MKKLTVLSDKLFSLTKSLSIVSLVFFSQGLFAAQAKKVLSYKQAIEKTIAYNPVLLAYPLGLQAAEAMKLQAKLTPNPVLGLTVENIAGSGDFSGQHQAEYTMMLSQVIELGMKQENRMAFAHSALEKQKLEYQITKLDVLAEASQRYYQLFRLQSLQKLLATKIELEKETVKITQQRFKSGSISQAEVLKIHLQLNHSKVELEQLTDEYQLAKNRLAFMWMQQANFEKVEEIIAPPMLSLDKSNILDMVNNAPVFMLEVALQRMADNYLKLTRSEGEADLTIGLGIKHFKAQGDNALVLSASMPLNFNNPNEGRIAAAYAKKEQMYLQAELKREELKLSLLESALKMTNLHKQLARLRNDLLPNAEKFLLETKKGYKQGFYSTLQWTDALNEHYMIEKKIIELQVQFYMQALELERITGKPLTRIVGEKS